MEQSNNQISLGMYRGIDLFLLSLITCAAELINIIVLKRFFQGELFTLSIAVPMSLIAMQRWNAYGAIVAAASGLAYCVANNGAAQSYAAYILGNLFVLICLLWYLKGGKKKIEESKGLQFLFALSGFLAVEVGRTLVAFIFEKEILSIFLTYIVSDSLNIVIGIVIVMVAAAQKGLFTDQLGYLRAIAEEREQNRKHISTGGYYGEEQDEESDPGRTDT